jgi:hypothetical protein
MRLTLVMVSVNYQDYLELVLPWNRPLFDQIVVVTSQQDSGCRELCRTHDVTCLSSYRMCMNGKVNKGRGINEALDQIQADSQWILLSDADILHDRQIKARLQASQLKPDTLYGSIRSICPTRRAANELVQGRGTGQLYCLPQHDWMSKPVAPPGRNVYPCYGFFQLFHASHKHRYDETHDHYAGSDINFMRRWKKRQIRTDLLTIHLGPLGGQSSWYSRKPPRF